MLDAGREVECKMDGWMGGWVDEKAAGGFVVRGRGSAENASGG